MKTVSFIRLTLFAFTILAVATRGAAQANSDCLACHADASLQDAAGHSVSVDGRTFGASIHGSLKCNDCHTAIKEYPHPDPVTLVKCDNCHADQAAGLVGSVHASRAEHPCTSCHGNAHSIFPKDDPKSAVYPLNIPRTCGSCHGNDAIAKKHGLPNVYPLYIDSIHGFALSKEGLLVAANCQSCHGSHHILSHKDPQSPTYKANVPRTCGNCHAGITADYMGGVHGKAVAAGNLDAPVCSDCHTAHAIEQPTAAAFRMQSTPICGNCHKDKFSTYRDTFHSQLGSLGGYVETARCWDCHGAHEILPAIRSPLPHRPGQPGGHLRQVPCGRQPQLRPVSAPCQRAQSQAEPGPLLYPFVYEPAADRHADVLLDSHHTVADPLAIRPDQE